MYCRGLVWTVHNWSYDSLHSLCAVSLYEVVSGSVQLYVSLDRLPVTCKVPQL